MPRTSHRNRESRRLIYGPYAAPRCHVGDILACEARGRDVKVRRLTDARIPWPDRYKTGVPSLILCGDLIAAVRTESATAVAHHWGVSTQTVWIWRTALTVEKWTPGTMRLVRYYIKQGQKASRSAESRAKHSATTRGRPALPQFRAASLKAAQRPKSEAWKRQMSARMKKEWAPGGTRRVQIAKRK